MMRVAVALASLAAYGTRAGKLPLPDLDTVLTKATSKAHDFTEQAAAMQQRLQEQQDKSRAALEEKKKEYEQKLHEVQQQNEAISTSNSELQYGNLELEHQNAETFAELKELQAENLQMRALLKEITDKVSAAQLFIADSLNATDDSHARELKVMAPTTPKPTLDYFLEVAIGRGVSLLAIGAKRHHDDPKELVSTLSNSLAEIKTAGEEGAAELQAQFVERMQERLDRQSMLNATQKELLQTKSALDARRQKLLEAKAHLQATGTQLRDRLDGMHVFADRLDVIVSSTLGLKQTANVTAGNASQSTSASPGNATQLALANKSNVTQEAANASWSVNRTVTALRKAAAAAVVKVAYVARPRATQDKPLQAIPKPLQGKPVAPKQSTSTPSMRKPVALARESKAAGWVGWFSTLR